MNSLAQQAHQAGATEQQQQGQPQGQQQDLGWVAPTLFVLLQSPLNGDPSGYGGKLLLRICRIISVTLPPGERLAVRQALTSLLSTLPAEVLAGRCLRPLQRYIDSCVQSGLAATRVQVRCGQSAQIKSCAVLCCACGGAAAAYVLRMCCRSTTLASPPPNLNASCCCACCRACS